jgi:Tol biopolymer transport system component
MTLSSGTRLGPYEVGEFLGAGGMGEVYRARDTKLNRSVALKTLPTPFVADPERLARFHREAQLLASLNHPNIGGIHGIEEGTGTATLVLEFVEGPTLADRLAQGPVPFQETLPIARQIAEALEAAHERGVIHRDLKPANIKLGRDGTVKVLDFGLAKALEPPGTSTVDAMNSPTLTARGTRFGVVVGTAAYMAPEQARGKPVDRRADIWAFGVVLFEMLAGRRPFQGETITDTIVAIVQREPDWLLLPAATTPRIRQLLRRCLEKEPRQRLHDIGDARIDIVDAIDEKPDMSVSAGPHVGTTPAARWPLYLGCGVAIALLAGVTGAWLPRRGAPRIVTRLDIATPPTSEPGSFAVSPDGRQIAFSADAGGGVLQLWLRSLDQRAAKPLAGTEEGIEPFWAPNGHSIAFFAMGRLKRLDVDTGVVQTLAAAPAPRGGTWNADGMIVFAPNTTAGLYRIAADGSGARELTHLRPGQYSHRWPHFLADGRRLVFSTFLGQRDTRGLFLTSLEGVEPRRILSGDEIGDAAPLYAAPGVLLTLRQGVLLARPFDPDRGVDAAEPVAVAESVGNDSAMFRAAVSASVNGVLVHRTTGMERRQLEWVDRAGHVLGHLGPTDDNGLAYPALSWDEQRVAVSRAADGNADIWFLDVKRGTFTRATSDPANDLAPLWSPDGKWLVFRSSRAGSFDLYLKSMTGTDAAETPLVADNRTKTALDWTPDGRTLLFGALDPQNGADLWAIDVVGDRKPYPVLRTPFDEMDAHISPDGRWMAYRSNESGRFEIYVRPFVPEGRTQSVQLISTAGGAQPCWSRTGKELFYLSPDGQMMAVPMEVSADRQSIVSGTPAALFPTHVASGTYITTAGTAARAQYNVSYDGRFLINAAAQEYVPPPISIVLNWDALLPTRR